MKRPRVSVVLPVRNEAGSIARTLDSILRQDYEGEMEVHLVDGDSDDGTVEILDDYASRYPQVTWSFNPDGHTARSLNQAIALTSGPIVVRCDGRSVLPEDYVSKAVATLESTGAANVGGIQNAVGTGAIQKAIAMATTSVFGAGDARFRTGGAAGPVDTVYLGVFRRDVLEEIDGFDERFIRNQDAELNSRIRKAGEVVYFTPELSVDYTPRSHLGALARQYFQYGRWRRATSRLHPEHLTWRQLAAPLLLLGLIGSLVALIFGLWAPGLAIPVAYATFLLVSTIALLSTRRDRSALLVPIVLMVIHLGWGAGYLIGPPE